MTKNEIAATAKATTLRAKENALTTLPHIPRENLVSAGFKQLVEGGSTSVSGGGTAASAALGLAAIGLGSRALCGIIKKGS